MSYVRCAGLVTMLALTSGLHAETPRFKFRKGETLTYHLVQTTKVTESVPDEKGSKTADIEATTRLDLMRNWQVVEVDANGVATLEMRITSMRMNRNSGGDEDVFDSSKPDDLNKNELAKHVGPVLAVIRVDDRGNLVEVKESKVGAATRFAADLPFKLTLPSNSLTGGASWNRDYTIQLDPPHGTGEKYAATQKFTSQALKDGLLPIGMTTAIKDMPAQASDQVPLVPLCPEGTVYFHPESGRYYAARLKVVRELKNHLGEGSVYRFASSYVEDLVPAK
jgi:hypothetical protein